MHYSSVRRTRMTALLLDEEVVIRNTTAIAVC